MAWRLLSFKKKKKCLTFPRMPFVPDHSASSSLKEAGSFLTNSQPSVLWGGSNSCFTIRSHLLRKTKNVPFLSETSGRAEHWNVINCSNWNLARTPRLTTYTYRRGKKKRSFNELRRRELKLHQKRQYNFSHHGLFQQGVTWKRGGKEESGSPGILAIHNLNEIIDLASLLKTCFNLEW